MNIAVSKGAKAGETFAAYVDFLVEKGFVPPDCKEWIDKVRTEGNEAAHEIALKERGDAELLIEFSEMLLKFLFEFPSRLKSKQASKTP
jgi:hypothetical protein